MFLQIGAIVAGILLIAGLVSGVINHKIEREIKNEHTTRIELRK